MGREAAISDEKQVLTAQLTSKRAEEKTLFCQRLHLSFGSIAAFVFGVTGTGRNTENEMCKSTRATMQANKLVLKLAASVHTGDAHHFASQGSNKAKAADRRRGSTTSCRRPLCRDCAPASSQAGYGTRRDNLD